MNQQLSHMLTYQQILPYEHIADLQREAEANRLAALVRSVAKPSGARFAGFRRFIGPHPRAAKSVR